MKGQLRLLGRKGIRWRSWLKKIRTPFLPQGDSTPIFLASLPIWVLASQAAGKCDGQAVGGISPVIGGSGEEEVSSAESLFRFTYL